MSAYYHNSAAALVVEGRIVAAAQEERFTRKKHDPRFPIEAIRACLRAGGLRLADLDGIVFYDKPFLKFERLLETHLSSAPRGFISFARAMPSWLHEKLALKRTLRRALADVDGSAAEGLPPLFFTEHHQAHAASAFFPSPFERAAVLCLDGVGEWATLSAWRGAGASLEPLWEQRFPHSLGLLYSAFTAHAGFRVNSGESKLMGLAPHGTPTYADLIRHTLMDLKPDGTFRLDLDHFDFSGAERMTNRRFERLFGGPARVPESPITRRDLDLAASIQAVTEDVVLRLVRSLHAETGERALCLAGGVALNCVANGRVRREGPFAEVWIQPAAGDAGGALGAALALGHERFGVSRRAPSADSMRGALLGPSFSDEEIRVALDGFGAVHAEYDDDALWPLLAHHLDAQRVVGWFQGAMEFGPRALGARSILGDPRSPTMQAVLNEKIKRRESFRPFAPAVLAEDAARFFELEGESPYMLFCADVRPPYRRPDGPQNEAPSGLDPSDAPSSTLPAVTHVDHSARVQTVHAATHPRFHALLSAFKDLTGIGVLINTSFNVRGEPIVATPQDADRCFMRTDLDVLVIGRFVLLKDAQPAWVEDATWQPFVPD